MIVAIASKGRPFTTTYKMFLEKGYEVFHFVEPQELSLYEGLPGLVNIGRSNGGIAYVRNFVLNWARQRNLHRIWICDDDVKGFGYAVGQKTIKSDAGILAEIEAKSSSLPFEVVGMNYVQHAWHEKKPYSVNSKFLT